MRALESSLKVVVVCIIALMALTISAVYISGSSKDLFGKLGTFQKETVNTELVKGALGGAMDTEDYVCMKNDGSSKCADVDKVFVGKAKCDAACPVGCACRVP